MPQSPFLSSAQAQALLDLVQTHGRRFATVAVNPITNDATCARDGQRVIIDDLGNLIHDDADPTAKAPEMLTIPTVVIAGRFPDRSKCTIACSPGVELDVCSSMTSKISKSMPCQAVRQGDRVWKDGQWLTVYRTAKHSVMVPA